MEIKQSRNELIYGLTLASGTGKLEALRVSAERTMALLRECRAVLTGHVSVSQNPFLQQQQEILC
jgi:hypothetical protein